MYINAKVWIGEEMWDEAENACYNIISKGHYSIEDEYETNFDIDNESSNENIFCIVYDRTYTTGYSNAFYLHWNDSFLEIIKSA